MSAIHYFRFRYETNGHRAPSDDMVHWVKETAIRNTVFGMYYIRFEKGEISFEMAMMEAALELAKMNDKLQAVITQYAMNSMPPIILQLSDETAEAFRVALASAEAATP